MTMSVGHREKLGQPQGGDEHRALGDVLALHKRFLYLD